MIKEEIIKKLEEILKKEIGLRKHSIKFLLKEIEKCNSEEEVIETVYGWEDEANGYKSRGETEAYYFQKEMFERVSVVLP